MVDVTQADREAAAGSINEQKGGTTREEDMIRSGDWDDHPRVIEFARHRTNSEPRSAGGESDWRRIAKLAGEHGVRYRTNTAFAAFLAALGQDEPRPAGDLREALKETANDLQRIGWHKDRGNVLKAIEVLATHSPAPMAGAEAPDEDWLTDIIDDSLDMDWTGRVGAKAIIAAWGTRHD